MMNIELYEELMNKSHHAVLINAAIDEFEKGGKVYTIDEIFASLKAKYDK